ncbi:MAG: trimethylamine methyltransferase family protein [Pirellulales bacterium]|nr:trimethylamine methyltransferase family protein [Pirellulales bacterium]
MIEHPRNYAELLSPDDVDRIHAAALGVLNREGLCIQSAAIVRCLADAGLRADARRQRVWFHPDEVERHLAAAPKSWMLCARNPRRSIRFGGAQLHICPGYGSPFVADREGRRRPATLRDFEDFTTLAARCDAVDLMSCLIVEPTDVPVRRRGPEIMRCLLSRSDKPLMGPVHSGEAVDDALAMARIVFGDLKNPCLLALININSPLRLDARMAEAMLAYLRAGQAILLTPGIMMGITAPATVAGALVQAWAELIGTAVAAQAIRPGAPLVLGTGGFGSDLRCGASGFGRPENAIGLTAGAQLARRVGLPYRGSAMVTGSRLPDCRGGYERMMTALSAWHAGAHLALQGLGILDCINSMSYEQFVVDAEIWGYLRRLAQPIAVDNDTLAVDLIGRTEGSYMALEHTVEHMRREIHVPSLAPPDSYEGWLAAGGPDVVEHAAYRVKEILVQSDERPLPDDARRALDDYVAARRPDC